MTKRESVSCVSVEVSGAGERRSLPILLSHWGLQHGPAQADRAGSHSLAMAEEGGEANLYPDGEGLVCVPRGRLAHEAAFPVVCGMSHPALISKATGGFPSPAGV